MAVIIVPFLRQKLIGHLFTLEIKFSTYNISILPFLSTKICSHTNFDVLALSNFEGGFSFLVLYKVFS